MNIWKTVFSPTTTPSDYLNALKELKQEEIKLWIKKSKGKTLFHTMFAKDMKEAINKMEFLFKEAKRLSLDPNGQWNPEGILSEQFVWNNTPLHLWLANERFDLVLPFLAMAEEYKFNIDLTLTDREGKTPLMLAVKMGNVPIEIVKALINEENYNTPDKTGVTPIMMACAMRRVDIIEEILQCHAKKIGLGALDFSNLKEEQKEKLSDFINQQHPETGKSLGHFAVMRAGTENDLKKKDSYQQTIGNIAKSVGIDARRDSKAKHNSPTNDTGGPIFLSKEEINFYDEMQKKGFLKPQNIKIPKIKIDKQSQLGKVFAYRTFDGEKELKTALLSSVENTYLLASKTIGNSAHLYKGLIAQIENYSGVSYADSILSRTEETVKFLMKVGVDFFLKQKQGDKTPSGYIKTLSLEKSKLFVTEGDKKYLFSLEKKIINHIVEQLNKKEEKDKENKFLLNLSHN